MQPFRDWLNLFLAPRCPLCQRSTTADFCRDCQRQLIDHQLPYPTQEWQPPLPVFAWGTYDGLLKRAIAALKYQNQPQIARPLGHWLGKAWLAAPIAIRRCPQPLIIVPIPLHAAKCQQRGYNQAELLAESFGHYTGLPIQRRGVERSKATEALHTLSVHQREQSLVDAFRLGPEWRQAAPGTAVLLLDDIYTTGATTRAAAQVLRRAGIAVHGVVAIARTQRYLPTGASLPASARF
ncbi:ComF family protein [Neosynechococcus sphagnicola]|uniref:ComF family protein n=1 Tax=Neosynechococcus sphagnicola TaxID=1501145 RepID=UPI00068ED863|nr:ComF family protein [Neosynechococcus sphagnicola]